MVMLRAWPLLTVIIDLIGLSIIVHAQNIQCVPFQTIMFLLLYTHAI